MNRIELKLELTFSFVGAEDNVANVYIFIKNGTKGR